MGLVYLGVLVGVSTVGFICSAHSSNLMLRVGLRLRNAMMVGVMHKMLRLSAMAKQVGYHSFLYDFLTGN